jgi:hypothetical protein
VSKRILRGPKELSEVAKTIGKAIVQVAKVDVPPVERPLFCCRLWRAPFEGDLIGIEAPR